MTALDITFATVDEVVARNPGATRRSVAEVLAVLPVAIRYAAGGAPGDALVTLNRALLGYEPVGELVRWFVPDVVNRALVELGRGDRVLLEVALDALGLLAETGEAYAAFQAGLAGRSGGGGAGRGGDT